MRSLKHKRVVPNRRETIRESHVWEEEGIRCIRVKRRRGGEGREMGIYRDGIWAKDDEEYVGDVDNEENGVA